MNKDFWSVPQDDDAAMMVRPVGREVPRSARPVNFLATSDATAMIERCPGTASLLPKLIDALRRQEVDQPGVLFDITEVPEQDRDLITQTLGEGEVQGEAVLPFGVRVQIQEAVMAGVWRLRFTDSTDRLVGDYIEVASIPAVVQQACSALPASFGHGPAPEGAMNVMPLLAEIADRAGRHQSGDPAHVITFSLFPMTSQDMEFLQATLGNGPVQLTSRGYGTCRVVSTGVRNVWSVQFHNTMGAIILNTLEICAIPAVALAAKEDFGDSAIRLGEIEEAYFK